MPKPALHIVTPTEPGPAEKARQRIRKMPKPASMIQCRCGGREVIETKTGVLFVDGKARGGTKALICAMCHRKGERVVLA